MRLGTSQTGATMYMEPLPVLQLNNAEAMHKEEEETQEVTVLLMLSR